MGLRWVKQMHGSEWAWSGNRIVAMVGPLAESGVISQNPSAFYWRMNSGIHMPRPCAQGGESSTLAGAKKSVRRSWKKFLDNMGLVEKSRVWEL